MRGLALLFVAGALAAPATAYAASGGAQPGPGPGALPPSGGASYAPQPTVAPGAAARIVNGLAVPPGGAPPAVVQAILRANELIGKPYLWGGGHRAWRARGYDCSGSVSYALHGGGLLTSPLDSASFERWGDPGPGRWVTVYANRAHAYLAVAGIRLDTSAAGDPGGLTGPRWRPLRASDTGFLTRHPQGL